MTTNQMIKQKLKENLPFEGQKWIDGMTPSELAGTETIYGNVGAERFVENWTTYKEQLDHLRHSFARSRHH